MLFGIKLLKMLLLYLHDLLNRNQLPVLWLRFIHCQISSSAAWSIPLLENTENSMETFSSQCRHVRWL